MSIQRWDPWRDIISLREAMNSLLEESFVRPRAAVNSFTSGMAVDLRETDDAYVVETALPGCKPQDVDISVLGDILKIKAETKVSAERESEQWLLRERRFGTFERSLTLPSKVRAEEADASFNDGVLTVTLPKAEETEAKSITVKAVVEQSIASENDATDK